MDPINKEPTQEVKVTNDDIKKQEVNNVNIDDIKKISDQYKNKYKKKYKQKYKDLAKKTDTSTTTMSPSIGEVLTQLCTYFIILLLFSFIESVIRALFSTPKLQN